MRASRARTVRSIRRISLLNAGSAVTRSTERPDRLVDELLEAREAVADLRELVHAPAGALGDAADRLHAAVHARGDALQRRLAVLDDVAQHAQREEAVLLPLLSRMICAKVTAVRSSPVSFSRILTSSPAFTQRPISSSVT
jgi:hypothetical protein